MAIDRRSFLESGCGSLAALSAGGSLKWDPGKPLLNVTHALTVQPAFMYRIPQQREKASWKSWGGIQTEEAARQEMARIDRELASMPSGPKFLPVAAVRSPEEAARLHTGSHDAVLLYACTGSGQLLSACVSPARDTLVFVRHRSGPVYYWYEALSTRYLASPRDPGHGVATGGRLHVDDVVVDDYTELSARLQGLNGARNLRGTRIVALGGPMGKYAADAPEAARKRFALDIVDIPYDSFARRLAAARADRTVVAEAEEAAARYLALPETRLRTKPAFVANAFILYRLFKEMMAGNNASAFTVQSCMGTIIPMSDTTACLSLSLLNDEGLMAFCESDFVIIPAGILLRHVAGVPVFLHNSTFPHKRIVTCAHCTGPRRMNGREYLPATLLTHYESDYGAAPKVEMPLGQEVTFIDPEYSSSRWVGIKGVVRGNPFLEICRSQQDVEIVGRWERLKSEARDSHWVMANGDHLAALGYAARKLGLNWVDISSQTVS